VTHFATPRMPLDAADGETYKKR